MGNAVHGQENTVHEEVNQVLANGPYFENRYLDAIGHPYYHADRYVPGDVTFRGRKYTGVQLKYDIYNKALVIQHPFLGFSSVLPEKFVDAFTIYRTRFKKIQQGDAWDYYQVVHDSGALECYFRWQVHYKESITDQNDLVPVFNNLKRKVWLSDGETLTCITNRRALVRYLSERKQPGAAAYVKEFKLRIRTASAEEMDQFMDYCNGLPDRKHSGNSDGESGVDFKEAEMGHLSLVDHLPDYQTKKVKAEKEAVDHTASQYIQTIGVSKDKIFEIGTREMQVKGRKCNVKGTVLNGKSGEPVIGATIFIKELEQGVISNSKGTFSLSLEPGIYTMEINHMAMQPRECGIKVWSPGSVDLTLEDAHHELQEVQVRYKRESNVEGMMMGFERISDKTMKEIPVVLGEKDILKVAQMLPGVQNVGEGSSGVNVRGGSPDQNLFMLNHVTVYNTSHMFGFFSAFSPDIISDFSLYKNNIPAKYGGRIASIFEINTRDGNPGEFFFHGGISPVTGHISLEGPLVKEKLTVVASARSTYSDWLLKKVKNGDIRNSEAAFNDVSLELNANLNASNKLKFFSYRSHDEFSLADRNDYAYNNLGSSLSWDHAFNDAFSSHLAYAYSAYDFKNIDKNNISEAFTQEYQLEQHEARLDFVITDFLQQRIEFGIGSILYQLNRGDISPFGPHSKRLELQLGMEHGLEHAVYLSDEFRITRRLGLLAGLRYSYYQALGPQQVDIYEAGAPKLYYNVLDQVDFSKGEVMKTYAGLEPRMTLNYSLTGNSSVKASYNRLHQYIFLLSNTIAVSPTDQWKLCDFHLSPPRSDQFSVGFYQDMPKYGLNLSAETYYKKIDHIAEFRDGADFISGEPAERLVLQGEQESYGLELMARKNGGRFSGWVSYTWSRSVVSVDGPEKAMRINNGRPYPSNFDRPHCFNLISNLKVNKRVSLSLNTVFMSGRPTTLPVSFYFTEKQQYLYFSERNAYRIPDYFRIDFSLNLEGNLKFKKPAHSFWMLNIYNLTGRNNAYSVFYESRNGRVQGYQLSIFAQPVVTVSWNLKFGNYTNE